MDFRAAQDVTICAGLSDEKLVRLVCADLGIKDNAKAIAFNISAPLQNRDAVIHKFNPRRIEPSKGRRGAFVKNNLVGISFPQQVNEIASHGWVESANFGARF